MYVRPSFLQQGLFLATHEIKIKQNVTGCCHLHCDETYNAAPHGGSQNTNAAYAHIATSRQQRPPGSYTAVLDPPLCLCSSPKQVRLAVEGELRSIHMRLCVPHANVRHLDAHDHRKLRLGHPEARGRRHGARFACPLDAGSAQGRQFTPRRGRPGRRERLCWWRHRRETTAKNADQSKGYLACRDMWALCNYVVGGRYLQSGWFGRTQQGSVWHRSEL